MVLVAAASRISLELITTVAAAAYPALGAARTLAQSPNSDVIPREFELPGEDAVMRKEGRKLIIEPAPPKSLLEVLDKLKSIDEDFPAISDRQPRPVKS